jgi:hypothetical protein
MASTKAAGAGISAGYDARNVEQLGGRLDVLATNQLAQNQARSGREIPPIDPAERPASTGSPMLFDLPGEHTDAPAPDSRRGPTKAEAHCGTGQADDIVTPIARDDTGQSGDHPEYCLAPPTPISDCEFDWDEAERDGGVVQPRSDRLACYLNPNSDVVLRRERDWNEEDDSCVVIARAHAPAVVRRIFALIDAPQDLLDQLCDIAGIPSAP